MVVVNEEQEKRSPNWMNHLSNLVGQAQKPAPGPFPGGTKTMRHKEMDSANERHAKDIALAEKKLSQDYSLQMKQMELQRYIHDSRLAMDKAAHDALYKLSWAEFGEGQRRFDLTHGLNRDIFDWEKSQDELEHPGSTRDLDTIGSGGWDTRKREQENVRDRYPNVWNPQRGQQSSEIPEWLTREHRLGGSSLQESPAPQEGPAPQEQNRLMEWLMKLGRAGTMRF